MTVPVERVRVDFPGDLEYIPAIRKFISDVAIVNRFPRRFAFRTEVIIDEICSNAVIHGSPALESLVGVECHVFTDRLEIFVDNVKGKGDDVKKLTRRLAEKLDNELKDDRREGRGLKIVKLLSNKVSLVKKKSNRVQVRVVKNHEDKPSSALVKD